jgi:hypothetical protein
MSFLSSKAGKTWGGLDGQRDTLHGPAGSHSSQIEFFTVSRGSDKTVFFVQILYFVTGEPYTMFFFYHQLYKSGWKD